MNKDIKTLTLKELLADVTHMHSWAPRLDEYEKEIERRLNDARLEGYKEAKYDQRDW